MRQVKVRAIKRLIGFKLSKTAVLIPCYNEEKTIAAVVKDFKENLPSATIYVYDNNSSDRTAEIARECGAVVRHAYKQGKGNAVAQMFREIEADCYIMVDGDDTYPATFAKEFEQLVLSGEADMVVGDRLSSTYFTENKRPFHNSGNRVVRFLINMLFGAKIDDIMTGARAFSRDFVKTYPCLSKGFEIETEMTIFALDNNFSIVQRPIDYRDRPEGSESKLSTVSDGVKVLKTIARLFRDTRPLAFFSLIALIILIVCLILFIPIWIEFLQTGQVLKFPTLIVSSCLLVVALLSFFSGIILSVLKRNQQESFKRWVNIMHLMAPLNNGKDTVVDQNDDQN